MILEHGPEDDFYYLYRWHTGELLSCIAFVLQHGKERLRQLSDVELKSLFIPSAPNADMDESVKIIKQLIEMDERDLLNYVGNARLLFQNEQPADKPGFCPVCGALVTYLDHKAPSEKPEDIRWVCHMCGTSGTECYHVVFQEHSNVLLKDGQPSVSM